MSAAHCRLREARLGSFLAGILLSLLPERYRRWWEPASTVHFRGAAFLSGLVQCVGCFLAFLLRYLAFFQRRVVEMGGAVIEAGAEEALAGQGVQFGMGIVTTLEYVLQPLTVLLIYFTLEGVVRLAGAAFTEEVLPTLPLHLVAWAQERLEARRAERALGPPVVDTVERGDGKHYDLGIASCRPKPNWDRLMTVAYEDEFYEVIKEERGARPRQFIYLLRKMPEGKVIRGLHHYRPDEPLQKP
ncbi:MAG: hypothetical protein HY656_04145 [Acidobacteria bacterium]|nr:hypothetical protein [Acidobacteriota bacterium]